MDPGNLTEVPQEGEPLHDAHGDSRMREKEQAGCCRTLYKYFAPFYWIQVP